MQRLWAPWRKKFITHTKPAGCLFCRLKRSRDDRKDLVVERGKSVYCVLNLYPYNNGHLMIVPYRHLRSLTLLDRGEQAEMFAMQNRMLKKLERLLKPQGFNLGYNIGRASGAGYEGHLHLHIVPRWNGDTNFMPTVSGDKVISQSLDELWKRLKTGRAA